MEVGCPRYSGASTIGSELLDQDCSHGNLALSPHVEGRKQAPVTLIIKQRKEKGGTGKGKQPLSRVPRLETRMLEESADNVILLKALWLKSMWNPGTCAYLTAADHKGKAYAPYINNVNS